MLALSGCIVTIDAIGTQTNIAKTIVEAEAGYVLSVTENQGHLYEGVSVLFGVDQAQNFKYASLEYAQSPIKIMVASKYGNVGVLPTHSTSISSGGGKIGGVSKALPWGWVHGSSRARKPSGCASISPVCPVRQIAF